MLYSDSVAARGVVQRSNRTPSYFLTDIATFLFVSELIFFKKIYFHKKMCTNYKIYMFI